MLQKLIILGILKEGPKHGYEIKKFIQKKLGVFAALENKSIYYPLKIMERDRLIKKETVKRKKRLTYYRYTITPRGNKEFLNLALESLVSQKRPFIDIDIPLYFLPHLQRREVIVRLRLRKRFLESVKKWLKDKLEGGEKFPLHQSLLLRHHLDLLKTEEEFVDEIVKVVKNY